MAVSYTHLDVYKRQQLSHLTWLNEEQNVILLGKCAVSYTHLDVYKRQKESIRADGSIVMVGNFDVDVEHQQRIGHLLGPLPPEMRDDTALMDRIHAYLPGWDVPKIGKEILTDHFGLVSDFLSECMSCLLYTSRCV